VGDKERDCFAGGQNRCKKGHTILFLLCNKKCQKTARYIITPRENFVKKSFTVEVHRPSCSINKRVQNTHTFTKCVFSTFFFIINSFASCIADCCEFDVQFTALLCSALLYTTVVLQAVSR
jgi:hypothetical protein